MAERSVFDESGDEMRDGVRAPVPSRADERRRFRSVLFRVLLVQVISVLLLWALQARYTVG